MKKNFCKVRRGHCLSLVWIVSFLLWGNVTMAALPIQEAKLSIQQRSVALSRVFYEIEKQTGYSFLVRNNDINMNEKVSIDVKNKSVEEVLEMLFVGKNIRYKVEGEHISVYKPQQSRQNAITGLVMDVAKEPVIGASVVVMGSTNGCITDFDGKFSLEVSEFPVKLQISYIGYKSQEVTVRDTKTIQVVLREDTETLDEVVVVGYGSQKKANLTGAVASVKMDEVIGNRPLSQAADALQGTVPGLFVSSDGNAPGKSKSFQIRGAYSVGIKNDDGSYGSAIKPLILIDNVEGDLDMVNPEDIETVTVLKDAASAAIYGARAAGGVILVTTKRPKGETSFQLNYNNNFAFATAMNLPEQAPLMEYLQAYSDAAGDQFWTMGSPSVSKWMGYLEQYRNNPSSIPTVGDGIFKDTDGAVYYMNEKDLVKNMLETSFQHTHNISMTGGTDKLRYRLSAGFIDNDGVLITDGRSGEATVRKNKSGIVVKGLHDLAVRFSRCCNPVPGDEIVGFVTRGRGVSIHRTDCINVINLPEDERERLIDAEWQVEENPSSTEQYSTEIQIFANNRIGLFADISKVFTEKQIDITSMNVRTSKQGRATIIMTFDIHGTEELNRITDKIRQIDGVLDIQRTTG